MFGTIDKQRQSNMSIKEQRIWTQLQANHSPPLYRPLLSAVQHIRLPWNIEALVFIIHVDLHHQKHRNQRKRRYFSSEWRSMQVSTGHTSWKVIGCFKTNIENGDSVTENKRIKMKCTLGPISRWLRKNVGCLYDTSQNWGNNEDLFQKVEK